ncbi:MAG: hypothetical protein QG656_1778, partial [Candidatus Hydrogenedentes bacterium]|nr:hypothetical protein [Candidatus Hydrogenedentota bacterium]
MKKRAFVAISVALICGLVFVGCPKPKITELEGLWNGDGALTSNWAFAENKVEYNMGLSVTVLTYTIAVNQKYTGTFMLDTA